MGTKREVEIQGGRHRKVQIEKREAEKNEPRERETERQGQMGVLATPVISTLRSLRKRDGHEV